MGIINPSTLIQISGSEEIRQEAKFNTANQNLAILEFPGWFRENKREPGRRVAFSASDAYNFTDPLFDTGILGPVRIVGTRAQNLIDKHMDSRILQSSSCYLVALQKTRTSS
ncbi:hypothetical protein BGZ61DRAFT_484555 [Ilyonectria robusta]|uniref:uncharacterized protein n=1 Tax=Ilyonectria robusta TaxID=1079257 RepID=UPI001E8EE36D|nr:uncharacterized protein BGZ61DRAFT_484555 [Ilyonectria robusta]KAH8665464.1 hypothetical protein BGZ61DRAFT_484555 [Ilyonectria robusta]